jgi:peptide deformylase
MRWTALAFALILPLSNLRFGGIVVAALLPKASEPPGWSTSSSTITPQPSLCDRRKALAKSWFGVIASGAIFPTASAAAAQPTFTNQQINGNNNNGDLLLLRSLEVAAVELRNGEDPFANRLNYPHPGLRKRASPVTAFGSDLEAVVDALVRTMETDATTTVQYGIDARIIILRGAASPNNDGSSKVFVNPNILVRSSEDKMVSWKEHCLTVGSRDLVWPEGEAPSVSAPASTLRRDSKRELLEVDLLRDDFVEVAAQDYVTGRPIRMVLQGEASRAFQHELDHLDGILIVDHAFMEDLPPGIAFLEEPYHAARQKRAFARSTYQGNGPLYF